MENEEKVINEPNSDVTNNAENILNELDNKSINSLDNKESIAEYLNNAYSGAKMMNDEEMCLRLSRAIVAFEADLDEDIFASDMMERRIEKECRERIANNLSEMDKDTHTYRALSKDKKPIYVSYEEVARNNKSKMEKHLLYRRTHPNRYSEKDVEEYDEKINKEYNDLLTHLKSNPDAKLFYAADGLYHLLQFKIHYKIDILAALKEKGYSTYLLRKEKIFGEKTLMAIRNNEPISLSTIEKICRILECNVSDILEYANDETLSVQRKHGKRKK